MKKQEIESWVRDVAAHTKPADIRWCNGSRKEAEGLTNGMLANGTLERLDAFGDRLPSTLWEEHRALRDRLRASIS